MKCPQCKLVNPDSAMRCDCGYIFQKLDVVQLPPLTGLGTPPQDQNKSNFQRAVAGKFFLVFVLIVLFLSLGAIFYPLSPKKRPIEQTLSADTSSNRRDIQANEEVPSSTPLPLEGKWVYSAGEDAMTGKAAKYAYVYSSNTLSFGFPYGGLQRAKLTLRNHPRYGTDVILSIEKGQFLPGIDGVRVLARFDERAPAQFWAVGPEDLSTTTLFIQNGGRFIANLKKAQTVRLTTPIYQEGEQVMEFNVKGLKW